LSVRVNKKDNNVNNCKGYFISNNIKDVNINNKVVQKKSVKLLRCIVCPEGCMLFTDYNEIDDRLTKIEGYKCKRGIKFAEEELRNPVRILTTTIGIDSKKINRLPVRSSIPAPKAKIFEMVREAKKIKVKPPIKVGDVLTHNFLNTGVDIISSTTIEE
jgi:CxxC motif-containing protein